MECTLTLYWYDVSVLDLRILIFIFLTGHLSFSMYAYLSTYVIYTYISIYSNVSIYLAIYLHLHWTDMMYPSCISESGYSIFLATQEIYASWSLYVGFNLKVIFIDVRKAFDTIYLGVILQKYGNCPNDFNTLSHKCRNLKDIV